MIYRYLYGTRRAVLARAGLLIAAIALIDWRVDLNISFGFHGPGLYGAGGCFLTASVHPGQFAAAGYPGLHFAGGNRAVRL